MTVFRDGSLLVSFKDSFLLRLEKLIRGRVLNGLLGEAGHGFSMG